MGWSADGADGTGRLGAERRRVKHLVLLDPGTADRDWRPIKVVADVATARKPATRSNGGEILRLSNG
jgi:hypothetical protein